MEKNQKRTMVIGGILAIALIVFVILALLAPHGEDFPRSGGTGILSGNLSTEREGIYCMAQGEEDSILIEGDLSSQWEFLVPEEGTYYLSAGYMPLEGNGQDLEFSISIDGEALDSNITLTRIWADDKGFRHAASGDEIRPVQSEAALWVEEPFRIGKKERLTLKLKAGKHSILLSGVSQSGLVRYLRLYREEIPFYEEYLAEHAGQNKVEADFYRQIEAEMPNMKSSSVLYAVYDRSSPYTLPYNPSSLRYNTIGGENWADDGQWIEWVMEVPEDGFYQLGLRCRQNENKGQSSLRRLEIDGKVPFLEMAELEFDYQVGWQSQFFGKEEPYLFYLTKGSHTLRMEVVLGKMEQSLERMQETLKEVNALYREIIMITGSNPDTYRDYDLETAVPDLEGKLSAILEQLNGYIDDLESRYGRGCYSSRILTQLATQIDSFCEKPYTIAKRLSVFKTNIEAFAEWILEFEQQPLQIDYFYLTGAGGKNTRGEGNFLSRAGHEIRAFIGSFFHSYNEVASQGEAKENVTLKVWMGKGRDQANVMKRLIDSYFTPESGINVNISLVEGALVKATLAGQGSDVNIFTTRGEAMNLAFRGAVLSLSEMEGFAELTGEYAKSAFVPYDIKIRSLGYRKHRNFM